MKKEELSKKILLKVPRVPGVYIFWDKQGQEIYIGKATNLKSRLSSYFSGKLFYKTKLMMSEAHRLTFIKTSSEFEALLLEANLVRGAMPKYNVQLKDDKSPIYIVITKDKFPRVLTARKTQLSALGARQVFGPFPESGSVKKVLKYLRKIFPYSEHRLGKRPCIYSQIGLCNPCPNGLTLGSERLRYLKNITGIVAILSGKISKVSNDLKKRMDGLSKKEKYEEAAELFTKVKALDYLTQSRLDASGYIENPNFAGDIRKKELSELRLILSKHMPGIGPIKRIECFDVAHLAGTYPTASMVSFVNGSAEKSLYRHFRITERKKSDDIDNIKSVLERRKRRADWGKSDLIIIDGGKGQVAAAKEIFGANSPVVGLTKKYETFIFFENASFSEIRLPRGGARNLVQRIRDEAHRFARSYHHLLVERAMSY